LASGDFVAAGAGTDLSGTFTQDIDGEARSAPWSIGADHIDYSIPTGTIIASDNFNRTNSSTRGANWTNPMVNYPQIISNTASGTGLNADEPAYYNAATFGNNQFSRVTVGSLTSGDAEIQLLLRASGTGASFNAYVATVGANGYITFSRYVNAGWVMDASSAVSFTAGDVAEFRVIGTTLQILKNGSVVASRTDTNYSSGKPGLGFWADLSAATADNWEGGEF